MLLQHQRESCFHLRTSALLRMPCNSQTDAAAVVSDLPIHQNELCSLAALPAVLQPSATVHGADYAIFMDLPSPLLTLHTHRYGQYIGCPAEMKPVLLIIVGL